MLDAKQRTRFRRQLLQWFDREQRDLPWRTNRSPYRVWISEIMLQQTQVATVVNYFQRFVARFPDVASLADADESEVLKMWEGLGYYRRARQLHAAAKTVVVRHGGKFPESYDDVLALPGIGRYTAGAILSISLDQQLPILEGNTIRLFARLLAMQSDPRTAANQKVLWEFAQFLLPRKRCGDFNQALMELGSEICQPRQPSCLICPVGGLCPTAARGLQSQIPVQSRKIQYESLVEAVVVIQRKQRILVRQCGPGERWQGLWDFPRFPLEPGKQEPHRSRMACGGERDDAASLADQVARLTGLSTELVDTKTEIQHAVTRYRIRLHCFRAVTVRGRLSTSNGSWRWVNRTELAAMPMSITGRKIADRLDD